MSAAGQLAGKKFANTEWIGDWIGDRQAEGLAEFTRFITKQYSALVDLAKEDLGGPTGMELFARLDASVVEVAKHRFELFINEVERTSGVNLFYDNFPPDGARLIGRLGAAIPSFIKRASADE